MKIFKNVISFIALMAPFAVIAGAVAVGPGANAADFQVALDLMMDWTQGTLGQAIALSMVVVGIIAGIARQSLMAFVIGIGSGMGLSFAPNILNNIFGAALPVM